MSTHQAHSGACITADHLSFSYGHTPVLEDISFSINQGEFVGLIGPNGSGKTTLMKIFLGLMKPTKGSVSIFGHTIDAAKHHYEIGYVPQMVLGEARAFPATVEEVVRSGRTARRGAMRFLTATDRRIADHALEHVGISALHGRLLRELSGGELQRVFIARALAREPKILILDEPTSGIDADAREEFYRLLSRLHRKQKLTILLVSHDIDAMVHEVEYVLCLNNRKLVCHLPAAEFAKTRNVRDQHGHETTVLFHEHA